MKKMPAHEKRALIVGGAIVLLWCLVFGYILFVMPGYGTGVLWP